MARIVVVTGGAGFIGSNIVSRLSRDPALDVVVCDRFREAESGKWRNLAKSAVADVLHPDALLAYLEARREEVEAVVHMGAVSSTTEADADKIVHANFTLSRDLFRWCAARERRLIYASSAATYGDGTLGFEDRDDEASLRRLRPLNAYGWSKALFDAFAAREAARGDAPPQWAGLKFFNVYGPNEYHKGGMRSVVAQTWPDVRDGTRLRLFKSHREGIADGGQRRDFVWVGDVADVVAWLLITPQVSGIYNLGSGEARSFADLARASLAAAGRGDDAIDYVPMPELLRAKYQYFTQADMTRLRAAGYTAPFTALEEGVRTYVTDHLAAEDPYL